MQLVSIPWMAVEVGATPFELGIVSALQFLPTLLLAALGGVMADRWNRGHLLMATQLGSATQAGALFVLAATGTASVLTVSAFAVLFGFLVALELPVRWAYLTELVPADDVASAVALHSIAWNTTRFIGPGIAGILIALLGVAVTFFLSSVISLVVAASIIGIERARTIAALQRTVGSVRAALVEGARFAVMEHSVRWALAYAAAGGIFGIMVFQTLAPLYASGQLGLGGGGYGALMTMWGAGALIGAYALTLIGHGHSLRWLQRGICGIALMLIGLAMTASVPVAFALACALGIFQITLSQSSVVAVQIVVPDRLRGRVMGLYTMLFQGTTPIGAVLAGSLAGAVGVPSTMLITASLLLAILAASSVLLRAHDLSHRPR